MKSITIHGIDDGLAQKIAEKSKEMDQSRNKTIKSILQQSLSESTQSDREREFYDLFGKWSKDEKAEFDAIVSDFEQIDDSDWKTT